MRRYLPACLLPVCFPACACSSSVPHLHMEKQAEQQGGAGSTLIIRLFLIESPITDVCASVQAETRSSLPVCLPLRVVPLPVWPVCPALGELGAWSVRKFHLLLVEIFAACVLKCLWQPAATAAANAFLAPTPPFRCGKVAIGGNRWQAWRVLPKQGTRSRT